jgi:hypothetical protein
VIHVALLVAAHPHPVEA